MFETAELLNAGANGILAIVCGVGLILMRALFYMIKRYIQNQDLRMRDNLADHNSFKSALADHESRLASVETHVGLVEREIHPTHCPGGHCDRIQK